MAEEIVKNIRLDDVLEFFRAAQPHRNREAPVGEMAEKHIVGQQAGYRDQRPPCRGKQLRVDLIEMRNARAKIERAEDIDKLVASVFGHQRRLARIQAFPQFLLGRCVASVILLDRVIRAHPRIIAAQCVISLAGHYLLPALTRRFLIAPKMVSP